MKVPLAWRTLTYDKRRTALALIGIFMAILLVFVQLGLFYAVPRGGLLLYDNMRFDLLLTSDQYEYQAQSGVFPLSQLERVRRSPDVAEATQLYFGIAKWKSGEGDLWPDVL
jgi:putative ABC transport system permease protein